MFDFSKMGDHSKHGNVPENYEEWLEEVAKVIQGHPLFFAGRSVFKFLRHLSAKESAFLEILESRGAWGGDDNELLKTKTEEKAKEINKETIKEIMKQITAGKVKFPGVGGKEVSLTPDAAIAAFNEFLVSDKDLDGSSVEILAGLLGVNEEALREGHRALVEAAKAVSGLNSGFNDLLEKMKTSQEEHSRRKLERANRKRDLETYLSKCRIAGAQTPGWKDRMDMLSGDKPIPDQPE